MGPIDKLDPDRIRPGTGRIGKKIVVYESTSSTNDVAAEYAKDTAGKILAEKIS